MRTCYDAAYPPAPPPATDAVLIYAGGDATHVWTDAEIAAQTARYRVPCWVRSNPQQADGAADATQLVSWLAAHRAPEETLVMLDLETAVDPVYAGTFGSVMHAWGYKVAPYGSTSTLFRNPQLDGYWPADYTGTPHLYPHPGVIATQYLRGLSFDMSVIADGVTLWDTRPAPTPQEATEMPFLAADDQHTYLVSQLLDRKVVVPTQEEVATLAKHFPALDANIPGTLASIPTQP